MNEYLLQYCCDSFVSCENLVLSVQCNVHTVGTQLRIAYIVYNTVYIVTMVTAPCEVYIVLRILLLCAGYFAIPYSLCDLSYTL